MPQKSPVSASFVKTASLFISVIVATVLTVKWCFVEIKDVIREEIKPLVERLDKIDDWKKETDDLLAVNTPNISAVTVSVNSFLEYYNRVYHKEFLRPSDISLTREKKNK